MTEIFEKYSEKTNFSFNLESAIYSGSLLSLFSPFSDRMEHFLRREYEIEGASALFLHHIYRAIFWLGKNKEEIEVVLKIVIDSNLRPILCEILKANF
ncbi:MAG: hypothetical protein ABDH37_07205 [Candidatus Hydrothermales bacterium]